jgi:hypothetical protein
VLRLAHSRFSSPDRNVNPRRRDIAAYTASVTPKAQQTREPASSAEKRLANDRSRTRVDDRFHERKRAGAAKRDRLLLPPRPRRSRRTRRSSTADATARLGTRERRGVRLTPGGPGISSGGSCGKPRDRPGRESSFEPTVFGRAFALRDAIRGVGSRPSAALLLRMESALMTVGA